MHGNHQNWKGNKGVLEGAPLSLHGGCLATPASRSLPAPSLFAPSALTPSQPFLPNHRRRSPRRALSGIHFTFSPLFPPPVIRVSVQRNTDALFFSCRAIPRPRILGPPSYVSSSACFLCLSPFRSVVRTPPKKPLDFIPFPETTFPCPAAPAARVGVSSSSASVAHFPHLSVLPCIRYLRPLTS